MSWTLLVPASAVAMTLVTLAWALHRIEGEVAELRVALRRSRAAAVAGDELQRHARLVAREGIRIHELRAARADARRARRRSTRR